MSHRAVFMCVAAFLGVAAPADALAGEAADLVQQVAALRADKKFAEAARLADKGARREDLDVGSRVALGGLAGRYYELSFDAGGAPSELCAAAAVLRHVAPLDRLGGASKLAAATRAEAKLSASLGPAACSAEAPVTALMPVVPVPGPPARPENPARPSPDPSGGKTPPVDPPVRKSPPTPSSPASSSTPDKRPQVGRRLVIAGGVSLGVAVGLAGVAGYAGARALGATRELFDLYNTGRGVGYDADAIAEQAALQRERGRWLPVTIGTAAAGAAAVVVGAVLVHVGKRRMRRTRTALVPIPGGLAVFARF